MAKANKTDDAFKLRPLSEISEITFVTSGIKQIDLMTGGLPRGRVTEIHGKEGVGKTSFVSMAAAEMSKQGKVLFIDAENALNPQRLKQFGADEKNLIVTSMHILEDVAELTIASVDKYDIIIVDSIAALVIRGEQSGQTGDHHIGVRAKLMGQWMRKIIGSLGKSKTALVFINQIRDNVGVLYGQKTITPGGHAVPYASSLTLELSTTKADRMVKDGFTHGHKVKVTVKKSKICPPHQEIQFKIEY